MAAPMPNPYQARAANFDDHDGYHDPYDARSYGASTDFTPSSSGIPAQNDEFINRDAGTPAQGIANDYHAHERHFSGTTYQGAGDASGAKHQSMPASDGQTYADEDYGYYSAKQKGEYTDNPHAPLVHNAATPGREDSPLPPRPGFQDLEYSDARNATPEKQTTLERWFAPGRYPLEQRIENKRRGIGRQKYPFLAWTLTVVMIGVLIYELVFNAQKQGTPISLKPTINPMLGPSQTALITLGARFPPCMKLVAAVPPTTLLGCVENVDNPPTKSCTVEQICAFGGFNGETPNQWFRFITPIFLHAGIVHALLNLLAQVLLSGQVEREMGTGGFFILYFAAGIFGNVLGGNFALVGAPSVGASGAVFGTVAVMWVDLIAHWKLEYRPVTKLIVLIVELLIGVAMGYIPGVDNFAHLGGFAMGLLCAIILYPVISTTRRHKLIMWSFRIAAIPVVVVLFIVLIRNFYTGDPAAACSWCRFLSCFPTAANNQCQGTGIVTTPSRT